MKSSKNIIWMKEIPSRCDHYGYMFNACDGNVTFTFGFYGERGYYICTKCGKKFFWTDPSYSHIEESHKNWVGEFIKHD